MESKVPPNNINAEKSVLGAMMSNKDALIDGIGILKAGDFYDPKNEEVFESIINLYRENSPVDLVTVCDNLKKNNSLEKIGGEPYVASLLLDIPSIKNTGEYAKIVSEKASLRKLIRTAEEIKEKSFDEELEADEILDYSEKSIFEIAQSKQKEDYTHIEKVLIKNMDNLDKIMKNGGKTVGLSTGYKEFDKVTSGLHNSDLIILAARPAMGKTALALNIALNAAVKSNASVLIFSLEMSEEQLGQRLLSIQSKIPMEKLKTGDIGRNEWQNLNGAIDILSKSNITIDESAEISPLEMKNKCRRLKSQRGLDLIIVDYLQLMNGDSKRKNEGRQQEISSLSRYLKLLAKEIDCPVIVLSQLSRAPEQRTDHRPILSDLRESGSIEQDADMVIFLYRDEYYHPDEADSKGICEVHIAKHRSGPTKKIDLAWVERYTKFSDLTIRGN